MKNWIDMSERWPEWNKLVVVHRKGRSADNYELAKLLYQNTTGAWFGANEHSNQLFTDVDYWYDVEVLEVGDE